ncbi:MAG: peptidylprolyl isomerase [Flavobacteriales bacterium]|nr:peptidylprolyl isomerase [Flavobacteriales bacterium]
MSNKFFTAATFCAFLFGGLTSSAQEKDPVLLTVEGQNITLSEFEAVYRKNNRDTQVNPEDVREYLDLYINFRLKVREAEELGLDTLKKFKEELKGYQKQLAKPYLTDKNVSEALVKEAYDRMKLDVSASHILLKVGPDALPKDTLAVYNRILDLRNRALKGDFEALAKQYSEDPSAADNGGNLGWFSAMRMVYPFETAAFNTPVGEISQPVRTRFGYHILKVNGKREASGELRVAHIMVKTGKEASEEEVGKAKEKAIEVKGLLVSGKSTFEELATKYSEDKGSASKGGELPQFGTGRMVAAFEKAAFALKNAGDVSDPVQTEYGWHIIKLLERIPVPTFDAAKDDLTAKVSKDSRSQLTRTVVIDRVKKEAGFREFPAAVDELAKFLDAKLLDGKWNADTARYLGKPVLTIGSQTLTQYDLAKFVGRQQTRRKPEDLRVLLNGYYTQFVEESVLNYEEAQLEKKYPEYKALLREYRDGILLFDLTDQKVWSKAVKDTSGLQSFHAQNPGKYAWEKRLDAELYHVQKDSILQPLLKELKKNFKSGIDREDVVKRYNANSKLNLRSEAGRYQAEDEELLKNVPWEKGVHGPYKKGDNQVIVVVKDVLAPAPKTLKECRGLVTADYQQHLEQEWIKELRSKYSFKANEDLLKRIK